jgi:chorismate mutase
MVMNGFVMPGNFDLVKVAALLEGLEETIIFKLIDRAQFRHNPSIYIKGKSGFSGAVGRSLFSLRLQQQEEMDSQFGRFCLPEERPFSRNLPKARRKLSLPATGLCIKNVDDINMTVEIQTAYLGLVPRICRRGDDGHHGSSVEHDVYALQAIARRIHYGALYVAESKFRNETRNYSLLIRKRDRRGLLALLTRRDVETRIIQRIRDKVGAAQTTVNRSTRHVIKPGAILRFYRDYIIPLTKEGEVRYLLNRTTDRL